METAITVLEFVNKVLPALTKVIGWAKKRHFAGMPTERIKDQVHVLFIDDKSFDVVGRIKTAGWSVERIPDIKSLDDERVRRAQVVFVDYKGVGRALAESKEGIGVIAALKHKYPQKRIILYSAHSEFSLADEVEHKVADDVLPKNSDTAIYLKKIEENARIALAS